MSCWKAAALCYFVECYGREMGQLQTHRKEEGALFNFLCSVLRKILYCLVIVAFKSFPGSQWCELMPVLVWFF